MSTKRTILFLALAAGTLGLAETAEAGGRWTRWFQLDDGHRDGIDFKYKIPSGRRDNTIYYAVRNRYRGRVRVELTLVVRKRDGTEVERSYSCRLRAGETRQNGGMWTFGRRIVKVGVKDLEFLD